MLTFYFDGLNENSSQRLVYLSVWFPVGGPVFEEFGGVVLLEGVSVGVWLRCFKNLHHY